MPLLKALLPQKGGKLKGVPPPSTCNSSRMEGWKLGKGQAGMVFGDSQHCAAQDKSKDNLDYFRVKCQSQL